MNKIVSNFLLLQKYSRFEVKKVGRHKWVAEDPDGNRIILYRESKTKKYVVKVKDCKAGLIRWDYVKEIVVFKDDGFTILFEHVKSFSERVLFSLNKPKYSVGFTDFYYDHIPLDLKKPYIYFWDKYIRMVDRVIRAGSYAKKN